MIDLMRVQWIIQIGFEYNLPNFMSQYIEPLPRWSFVVMSGGILFEEYGYGGPGVCLGDGQTEAYLKDMDMTGLASAWAMARRRPI